MIKLIFMDVDGTLTDGKIYMGNDGEMFKAFDIKDGCGIHDVLPKHNILPVVITARDSEIVSRRCAELGITECYQGVRNKVDKMREIIEKYHCMLDETAYIGDDIIDLECMKLCGLKGCPADAVNEVKQVSDYVCNKPGGKGAVREFIEYIVS